MTDRMKIAVFVRFRFEGFHHWPDARKEEPTVGFLADVHRHIFHVRAALGVDHEDRDVEFILLKRRMEKLVRDKQDQQPEAVLSWSCEHWARFLVNEFDLEYCEVSEDGENGAVVYKAVTETVVDEDLCAINRRQWDAIEGIQNRLRRELPQLWKAVDTLKAREDLRRLEEEANEVFVGPAPVDMSDPPPLFEAGVASCKGCKKEISEDEELCRRIGELWHRTCLEATLVSPDGPNAPKDPVAPPHKIVEGTDRRGDGLTIVVYTCVCGASFGQSYDDAQDHLMDQGLPF